MQSPDSSPIENGWKQLQHPSKVDLVLYNVCDVAAPTRAWNEAPVYHLQRLYDSRHDRSEVVK